MLQMYIIILPRQGNFRSNAELDSKKEFTEQSTGKTTYTHTTTKKSYY